MGGLAFPKKKKGFGGHQKNFFLFLGPKEFGLNFLLGDRRGRGTVLKGSFWLLETLLGGLPGPPKDFYQVVFFFFLGVALFKKGVRGSYLGGRVGGFFPHLF